MSSIKRAFAAPTVLVPFVTCGDPDLETTKEVVKALAKNGAGIVELGIPFSDPTGERSSYPDGFQNLCQCGFRLRD